MVQYYYLRNPDDHILMIIGESKHKKKKKDWPEYQLQNFQSHVQRSVRYKKIHKVKIQVFDRLEHLKYWTNQNKQMLWSINKDDENMINMEYLSENFTEWIREMASISISEPISSSIFYTLWTHSTLLDWAKDTGSYLVSLKPLTEGTGFWYAVNFKLQAFQQRTYCPTTTWFSKKTMHIKGANKIQKFATVIASGIKI